MINRTTKIRCWFFFSNILPMSFSSSICPLRTSNRKRHVAPIRQDNDRRKSLCTLYKTYQTYTPWFVKVSYTEEYYIVTYNQKKKNNKTKLFYYLIIWVSFVTLLLKLSTVYSRWYAQAAWHKIRYICKGYKRL